MELELKHLVPYLPYGLKLQYVVRDKLEQTGIMKSVSHNEDETHPTRVSISAMYNEEHIWMFKPILRPLSDIDNVIPMYGEKGIPSEEMDANCLKWLRLGDIAEIRYSTFDFLIEHHFDVFGLIDKGLAIDINTL